MRRPETNLYCIFVQSLVLVVFLHIRLLRKGGRPIPDHEANRPEYRFTGDMTTMGSRFELRRCAGPVGDPVAVLYEVKVLSIRGDVMRLRGYEEHNGAGVLQEWECKPVGQRIGPHGYLEWDMEERGGRHAW
jgi:hypothetical protein